jgi:hypothetical protein
VHHASFRTAIAISIGATALCLQPGAHAAGAVEGQNKSSSGEEAPSRIEWGVRLSAGLGDGQIRWADVLAARMGIDGEYWLFSHIIFPVLGLGAGYAWGKSDVSHYCGAEYVGSTFGECMPFDYPRSDSGPYGSLTAKWLYHTGMHGSGFAIAPVARLDVFGGWSVTGGLEVGLGYAKGRDAGRPSVTAAEASATEPTPAPAPASEPERAAKNAIYLELFGPAVFYSLNYERVFGQVAGRVGLGFFDTGSSNYKWFAVPLTATYLGIGSKTHMFEIGGGIVIHYFDNSVSWGVISSQYKDAMVLGALVCGYRFQPPNGGFFFRAGVSPVFGSTGGPSAFLPWPHVGLGATF